jgi:hypothetical protein
MMHSLQMRISEWYQAGPDCPELAQAEKLAVFIVEFF